MGFMDFMKVFNYINCYGIVGNFKVASFQFIKQEISITQNNKLILFVFLQTIFIIHL